ncbi:hypothetical protein GmHk_08G024326 [Glycine max]|nr:hypothetical protein GmHk_08G024326 [Glycine max]
MGFDRRKSLATLKGFHYSIFQSSECPQTWRSSGTLRPAEAFITAAIMQIENFKLNGNQEKIIMIDHNQLKTHPDQNHGANSCPTVMIDKHLERVQAKI